jgi:hypothetical protein
MAYAQNRPPTPGVARYFADADALRNGADFSITAVLVSIHHEPIPQELRMARL